MKMLGFTAETVFDKSIEGYRGLCESTDSIKNKVVMAKEFNCGEVERACTLVGSPRFCRKLMKKLAC